MSTTKTQKARKSEEPKIGGSPTHPERRYRRIAARVDDEIAVWLEEQVASRRPAVSASFIIQEALFEKKDRDKAKQ